MKTEHIRIRNIIFGAMIVNFILLAAVILRFNRLCGIKLPPSTILYFAGVFLVLAAVQVVLTIRIKESGIRKFFFLLTSASALGIPVFIVLHNLIYALCVKFGWAFQKGEDEPVCFIMAIFICPALFLLGALGSIVLFILTGLRKKES